MSSDPSIRFTPRLETDPLRLEARAELHFSGGLLAGMKLVGFTLWRVSEPHHSLRVTVPSRPGTRFSDFLRAETPEAGHQFRQAIINAYQKETP